MAGHINHVLKVANSFVMMNLCYSKALPRYVKNLCAFTFILISAVSGAVMVLAILFLLGYSWQRVTFYPTVCVCYLPKKFCDEIIIIDPQFSVFRRENSSYKKPDHSSSSTVFIRCFDSALGEDQVV
jgi:hypothetical protein